MPRTWYNVRADMKNKPAPLLQPRHGRGHDSSRTCGRVFCDELIRAGAGQRHPRDPHPAGDTRLLQDVPPLARWCGPTAWRKSWAPRRKIYYKFEGNNTSGSHKLNSAIAQAYYAKNQGLQAASPPRPAPDSGAPRSPWPAPTWASTARSTWSSAPMSRSPSAARSCAPTAPP